MHIESRRYKPLYSQTSASLSISIQFEAGAAGTHSLVSDHGAHVTTAAIVRLTDTGNMRIVTIRIPCPGDSVKLIIQDNREGMPDQGVDPDRGEQAEVDPKL